MSVIRFLKSGAALCTVCAATLAGASAHAGDVPELTVSNEVSHDTSPPLADMIRTYKESHANQPAPARHVVPLHRIPIPPRARRPDGIQGPTMLAAPVPTTDLLNFDGVDDAHSDCDCAPPDTNGAVGATQYVQWVNSAFAIYDKTNGTLISGPTAGNALWIGFPGRCAKKNDGDINAQYDKVAQRWVMEQPVFSSPYRLCIAVSTTSDATGSYNRYEFDMGTTEFPDYPKLGIWPAAHNSAYFVTVNNFLNGNGFDGPMICAIDRNKMLAGGKAMIQCKQLSADFFSLLPGDFDGTIVPSASHSELLIEFDFTGNSVSVWQMNVNFRNPAMTTLTGPTAITVPAFTLLCNGNACIPQKGTTTQLDSLADRLMYRFAYRRFSDHEAWVTNHSVDVNGRAAIRWYEFRARRGNVTLFQSGNVTNPSLFYWMGSIAMDKAGDMAVGFSASSANIFPGITYAGRVPTDRRGKMRPHAGFTTKGGGSQDGNIRWGDYSAMSVDPVDDCTFYYTTEYLKATGDFNWSTRINSFKFDNCDPS